MRTKAIVSGAIILIVGNILSSLLGLFREMLLAAHYGTGMDMDSYLFANTIPAIILAFMSGIFSSGFIPLYIRKRVEQGGEEATLLYSSTINWTLLIMLAVAAAGYALSPQLASLFASTDAERAQTAKLLWILLPTLFFFTLSYAQSAVLNSVDHFTMPALLTAFNNVIMIAFIVLFHRSLGIYSVAWGYMLGTVVQFLVQLPIMKKKGLRYRIYLSWRDESLRKLLAMSIPIAGLVVIDQCSVLALRYFAADLAEGSASALNFANRIVTLPISLFGTAIVSSTFPSIVQLSAENKRAESERLIRTTIKGMLLVLVPVAVLCAVFAHDIIRALLERGAFDREATRMTSFAFVLASVGIVLYPVRDFCVKLLISRHRAAAPILSSLIYAAVFIAGCALTVPHLAYRGIAVSGSAALVASFLFLLAQFRRSGRKARIRFPAAFLFKLASSSAVGALAALVFRREVALWGRLTFPDTLLTLTALGIGMCAYAASAKLWRIEEINFVYGKLLAKFRLDKKRGVSAKTGG